MYDGHVTRIQTSTEIFLERAAYLGEGDFSVAWLINGEWVCRIAKHAEAAASLGREARLLPQIAANLPLPIPQPACYGFMGRTVAIHTLIPGEPLTRDQFLSLDGAVRDRCTRQLAEFLAVFHRTNLAMARQCGIKVIDYPARYREVRRRAEEHLLPRLNESDRAYVRKIFREFLAAPPDPAASVLLHGDLSPEHVLWNPADAQLTGVLDFGDMQIGDAAWDLVFLLEDYGPEFVTLLLRRFPSPDNQVLLRCAHQLRELDTVEWAASVCSGERDAEGEDPRASIAALREPWE